MAKKLNSFSSPVEKNDIIFNKYLEVFSSDLAQVNNRFSYDSEKYQSFLLHTKSFDTLRGKHLDCESIATVGKTRSGFSVMITIYSGKTEEKVFSYSMSIYPCSVKTIEDIEGYARFKMLKKFVKNRDEVLENIYEGLRLFNITNRYGRSATIRSSRIVTSMYNAGRTVHVGFPVNPLPRNHPVNLEGDIFSHIKKDDLPEIKTIFDRDDRIKANVDRKVNTRTKINMSEILKNI